MSEMRSKALRQHLHPHCVGGFVAEFVDPFGVTLE